MMKLETIELLLQLPNLLSVCHNVGVTAVRLPHDFVYNELRVTMNVKPLNPELSGDVQVIDECLVFHHIIGREEVQSNHVEEPVSLGGDQHYASPGPIESERVIKIHAPVLLGDRVGGGLLCLGPFDHEIHQSLGLDFHLWGIGYVELESPLGDPPHGETVSNNFPEPI
jgi:hypothetical protein